MSISGTQIVTVSYTEDDVTATTDLTIDVLTLNKITATGYKTAFRAGETFSFGGTVYPWYTHSNGSSESQGSALSSDDYTVSKFGILSMGDGQEVIVSYGGKTLKERQELGQFFTPPELTIQMTDLIHVPIPYRVHTAEKILHTQLMSVMLT